MNREKYWISAIVILAWCFYFVTSFFPHYFFNSNAWDLWIFNQSLWLYSHGHLWPNTLRHVDTLFADHFEILLFPLALFRYLLGSYTLLFFQGIFLLMGGWGIYLLWKEKWVDRTNVILAVTLYFSFFGIFQALIFDYHNNVTATWLIPWIYYFFHKKKYMSLFFIFMLFILAKENLWLLGFAISIGFLIDVRSRREFFLTCCLALISLGVFFILVKYIIPYFNHWNYAHWEYKKLGADMFSACKNLILSPIESFSILFNSSHKIHTWWILMLSWVILLISPRFLLVFLVLLGQKLFSESIAISGTQFHYSVEFAPFIAIAVLSLWAKNMNLAKYVSIFFIWINSIFVLTLPVFSGYSLFSYLKLSYVSSNRSAILYALDKIDPTSSVSASNTIVSHISFRKEIYLFPEIQDANYIIVDTQSQNIWPFMKKEEQELAISKISSRDYALVYQENGVYLWKRIWMKIISIPN